MLRWKRDVLYGVAILIFCALCYWATRNLPLGTTDIFAARADVYVWFWLLLAALLGVLLIIKALVKRDSEVLPPIWSKVGIVSVVALVLYLLIMPRLGFTLSTFLFLLITILASSKVEGKLDLKGKKLWIKISQYVAFSIIATLVTEKIFRDGLDVLLPTFSLF
jgi:hypothetical protein